MENKDLPSHGIIEQFPMDIAPEMKLIKAGIWNVKAEQYAVSRLNPHPDGGEGIDESRSA